MRDARSSISSVGETSSTPADDLADVWDVLDRLPSAKLATDLTATTVELVAAKVTNDVRPTEASQVRWIDRLVPLAIIVGGLALGLVAGRVAAPDPDTKILERLPIIEHLALLQELGSVEFLESLAGQMRDGQANPPRWLRFMRDPSGLRGEAKEFDAILATLLSESSDGQPSDDKLERRRQRVADLTPSDLAALEKSAATFEAMTSVDRRELERLAAVLADPARKPLHAAAQQWHLIVTAYNPAFRRNIIEMSKDDRLEWLARSAGRDGPWQQPVRPRDDERGGERRPLPPRREGTDERPRPGDRPSGFQRPPNLPPRGEHPGPPPPPPDRPMINGPAMSRPGPPREAPAETPEAPR